MGDSRVLSSHKSRFWNSNQTVRFDRINRKPLIKTVLLILITGYYKKFREPWEPPFKLLGLKTLSGSHSSDRLSFFFFGYLQPLLLTLQAFNFNHPPWDYQSWDCTPSSFFFYVSIALSLSLCVFADAVYLHFCLWSLLLLQFFVDDVLPCLLSTTKGLFYCYPLMPVVKHFLNFRVLDLYLTHFFIGGQTNVCPPTLVFFLF